MKKMIAFLTLIASVSFAKATNAQLIIIKNNLEIKSAVEGFENNRSQTCNEIKAENVKIAKNRSTEITISCNEYDHNGDPQANVHIIKITGYLYVNSFDVQNISISGLE